MGQNKNQSREALLDNQLAIDYKQEQVKDTLGTLVGFSVENLRFFSF